MKYSLLILFTATLASCETKKQEIKSPYFEGIVSFENRYEGNERLKNSLKEVFGARAITYINSKGYTATEYIDSNNIIISKQIYRPDSLKYYQVKSNSDTIFFIDAGSSINSKYLGITKNNPIRVLNHNVEISKKSIAIFEKGLVESYYIYTTYFNDVNYLLSPAAYQHVLYGNVEEIFTNSPHITTQYVFQYNNSVTITRTASQVISSTVPDWRFDIPKNKALAKQRN